MPEDRWGQLDAFLATLDHGSFSAAARARGTSPQAVARAVARLEARLGVALFRRTTRAMTPTTDALSFAERVRPALARIEGAEQSTAARGDTPSGRVRISAPTTWAHLLLPMLPSLFEAYPNIRLDLDVNNLTADFVKDGFDLAIRMGRLRDSSLMARKLGDYALGVYASPAYLAHAGHPGSLEDLDDHRVAVFVMPQTGVELPWRLPGDDSWLPRDPVRILTDFTAVVAFARHGGGIVQAYDFLVAEAVARGELVEVLPQLRAPSRLFSLVYPARAAQRRAVRVVLDHIQGRAG
jgi:DNA-binding transcriptional LysR family regulator